MPERIVDLLEPVEIDQQQMRQRRRALRVPELGFERGAVEQSRQLIVIGETMEFILGDFAPRDVARNTDQPDDRAVVDFSRSSIAR